MKTITNLSLPTVTDDGKPSTAPMQSVGGRFQRRQRQTAIGIFFESSAGGQVLITNDALWAEAEKHELLLVIPAAPKTI